MFETGGLAAVALGESENLTLLPDGQFVNFLRKFHRPRHGRRASVKLAVDEIGHAAEEKSEWRADHEIVAQSGPIDLVTPRIPEGVNHHTKDAAMGRHAAFPNTEEDKRVGEQCGAIIEKKMSQPSADKDAEHRATGDEITDLVGRDNGKPSFRQVKIDEIRRGERRKVSDAIPTDAEAVAELHGERIDVVNQ